MREFELDQRLRGETHRPLHGLAVDEGLDMRVFEQRFADRLRRLDEEAEEVVVLDLELAGAGRLDVARLQLGDDAAAVVTQLQRLVELGAEAHADEAAVTLFERQFVGQRGGDLVAERAVGQR